MKKQESYSLPLTSEYFGLLLENIKEVFKKKHNLIELPKSMQFYGYGNYNPERPSLRGDLERIGSDFINGKYLYDKVREFHKGKPVVRLNQYYKSIVLLYLGFENIEAFLEENKRERVDEKSQMALLYGEHENKSYYYVNYYFGEEGILQKGKTIISNNWKRIKNVYRYAQKDGAFKEFYDFGTIIKREDSVHIKNKTMLDGKLVEGASEIFYTGQNNPSHLNFLVGVYSTFDIYNNSVAGRCILEKCESEEELTKRMENPSIPAYIAMEIRNQRIVNKTIVPKHFLELSKESPYASIYEGVAGEYELVFNLPNNRSERFRFKVLSNNFKIVPLDENVYLENDKLELLNRGSVVHFSFNLSGIIAFDRIDVYLKTYYLKNEEETQDGVFSGIDNENRLVNGNVNINFQKA